MTMRALLLAAVLAWGSAAAADPDPEYISGSNPSLQPRAGIHVLDGLYLVRLDPGGSGVWGRSMPCTNGKIAAVPNGSGVILAAKCSEVGRPESGGKRFFNPRPSVLRFDATGTPIWGRAFAIGEQVGLDDIVANSDGSVIVAGSRLSRDREGSERKRPDPFLVHLTSDGVVAWARTFQGSRIDNLTRLTGNRLAFTLDAALVLVNSNGAVESARSISVEGSPFTQWFMTESSGRLMLATGSKRADARGADIALVAVSEAGDIAWSEMIDVGPADRIGTVTGGADGSVWIDGIAIRMGETLEDAIHPPAKWRGLIDRNGALVRSETLDRTDRSSERQGAPLGYEKGRCAPPAETLARVYPVSARSVAVPVNAAPLTVTVVPFTTEVAPFEPAPTDLCGLVDY